MVCISLSLLFGSYLAGSLRSVLLEVGTVPVSLLFGYLWLLTLVAAGTLDVRLTPAAVGSAALSGGVLALVYLTVVLVIGFVAPVPDALDPATVSIVRVVVAGVVTGSVIGGLAVLCFGLCRKAGAFVAGPAEQG